MVDEYTPLQQHESMKNWVQIPLWSMNTETSRVKSWPIGFVQIPLWSMNTYSGADIRRKTETFRFLYGRWIQDYRGLYCSFFSGSDSSMVDEYRNGRPCMSSPFWVQIPLWSMNTICHSSKAIQNTLFRFLYGRWIRRPWPRKSTVLVRSDSSMVDEYVWFQAEKCRVRNVQIPLWSMNTANARQV